MQVKPTLILFGLLSGIYAAPVVVTKGSVIADDQTRELDEDTTISGYGYKRSAGPVVVTEGSVISPNEASELNEDTSISGYGYKRDAEPVVVTLG